MHLCRNGETSHPPYSCIILLFSHLLFSCVGDLFSPEIQKLTNSLEYSGIYPQSLYTVFTLSPPRVSVYRTLGTPDDRLWPGVSLLPDYKNTFPKWPRRNLQSVVKNADPLAIDILEV